MMARYSEYDPGGRDLDRLREGDTLGSGSFRNDGNDDAATYFSYRDAQAKAEGRRELPRPKRPPVPSLYDAFTASEEAVYLTEGQMGEWIGARARELVLRDPDKAPARAVALQRVAERIARHQADWDQLSQRDKVDAWAALMEHELTPGRRHDGSIDAYAMEEQALAAAGRGSLDLSAHPELRMAGRDIRGEWEAEKTSQRGNQ